MYLLIKICLCDFVGLDNEKGFREERIAGNSAVINEQYRSP